MNETELKALLSRIRPADSTGRFSRQASTAADVVVLPIPISPMPSASAPELCARSAASIPIAMASTA